MKQYESEALLLSLLGPRPVFWRDDQFDEIFCAWNGIIMTQKHALMVAGELFWNQSPTPEMKRQADRDLVVLYNAGAFSNTDKWHFIIKDKTVNGTMHSWYKRKINPVIQRYLKETQPQEVYSWFNFKDFAKI